MADTDAHPSCLRLWMIAAHLADGRLYELAGAPALVLADPIHRLHCGIHACVALAPV